MNEHIILIIIFNYLQMSASKEEQKDDMRRQLNNAYIENKLSAILEPLVASMLKDQPADHVSNL